MMAPRVQEDKPEFSVEPQNVDPAKERTTDDEQGSETPAAKRKARKGSKVFRSVPKPGGMPILRIAGI